VIYIPGNHDEFVAGFIGHFGAVEILPRDIHTTADGRRLLIIHGHELDTVIQNIKWLAYVGDVGYTLLLKLNTPINALRRAVGLHFWSLSAYVKKRVKDAVSFIGEFEKAIVQYARQDRVDGVVCGHIHSPVIRMIGETAYYNSGDWVESLSALVEHADGSHRIGHAPTARRCCPGIQGHGTSRRGIFRHRFGSGGVRVAQCRAARLSSF